MTLIAAVLIEEGLLFAADSRQRLVQVDSRRDDAFKIRLVTVPPRCVFGIAGLDVIYDVPNPAKIREGWTPRPSEILLDFGAVAESQLMTAQDGVNLDLLGRVATDCVRAMNEHRQLDRRQLGTLSGQPFTQLIIANAARTGRNGRLGVVDLWVRTDAPKIQTKDVRCKDLYEQGDPYFFGDLGYVERELSEEYARCQSALSRTPLSVAAASAAIKGLVDAAGSRSESPIGGPTDIVLISSEVRKLSWKQDGTEHP